MPKPTTNETSPSATPSAQTPAAPAAGPEVAPPQKKKKKKKYSTGLSRVVQELESGMNKGARKVAKAVRKGLGEYKDRRDDSAGKKKDGALRDLLRNQSKALRKGLPIAAKAPAEILDAVADLKPVRRLSNVRKLFRT